MTEETKLDAPGRVVLWKSDSDNQNAPTLKGHLYTHRNIRAGEKIDIALWRNDRNVEGSQFPVLTGKVSDVRVRDSTGDRTHSMPPPPPPPPAANDDFDDDIPF